MSSNDQQAIADEALVQLGRRLRADGYRFTCVSPATHARNNSRPSAKRACTLRDVFGWSRSFNAELVSADELQLLREAKVIEEHGKHFRSSVRWSNLDEMLLVHSAYPTNAADAVFFGPDSYRFAQVIHDHLQRSPKRIEHALDVGCGSGIGALLIARAAQHAKVTAVDVNPLALRYTAINAALAGLNNVSVQASDVLDGVSGTFDLIVANPPYMLDGKQRQYRHGGGVLGAQLSLRILQQGCARLAPGGTLLLYTGVAIVEGHDALLEAARSTLGGPQWSWVHRELDPDVFGEQLLEAGYEQVERIAAVALSVTRNT